MTAPPSKPGRGRPAIPDRLPGTRLPDGYYQLLRNVLRQGEKLSSFQRDLIVSEIDRRRSAPETGSPIDRALTEAKGADRALAQIDQVNTAQYLQLNGSAPIALTENAATLIIDLLSALAAGADVHVVSSPIYVTRNQAAEILGTKPTEISRIEKAGKIPAFGSPRNRLYRLSDILPLRHHRA